MKELIYKKGIILKVSSWENDGDHSRNLEHVVKSLEEGKAYQRMCSTLFKPNHEGPMAIANDYGAVLEHYEGEINEFFDGDEFLKYIPKENRINEVEEIAEVLMGYSEEGYSCRVCDSCTLYEVKEDVYLDLVEIK